MIPSAATMQQTEQGAGIEAGRGVAACAGAAARRLLGRRLGPLLSDNSCSLGSARSPLSLALRARRFRTALVSACLRA